MGTPRCKDFIIVKMCPKSGPRDRKRKINNDE